MLAPENYYFLHQELSFFVRLQPIKKLHSAPLKHLKHTDIIRLKMIKVMMEMFPQKLSLLSGV